MKIEGPDDSGSDVPALPGWAPSVPLGIGACRSSGVHFSIKSYFPVRPVRSTTVRGVHRRCSPGHALEQSGPPSDSSAMRPPPFFVFDFWYWENPGNGTPERSALSVFLWKQAQNGACQASSLKHARAAKFHYALSARGFACLASRHSCLPTPQPCCAVRRRIAATAVVRNRSCRAAA